MSAHTRCVVGACAAAALAAGALLAAGGAFGAGPGQQPALVDAARGAVPVPDITRPPRLGNPVNDDRRQPRGWERQPPIIPHRIDGYQVDKNFNKCLDCHARARTEFSQAVPVSETHYIDRSGKRLEQISTRRYFCNQCHVAQDAVAPLVDNTFRGLGTLSAPTGHSTPKP
ncbi:MAG: nitrate reductase cytochrome c-type subunit [Burkholderiaceae bacterium]|nr:nitrate reductase cytochrome c-type subunit [Burkholderiaceae bacterium]